MRHGRLVAFLFALCLSVVRLQAEEPWPAALAGMPLPRGVHLLTETNCVSLMLNALQSNNVVKGLVFMPGATDEFYMFHRALARLPDGDTSMLDAVTALTNQTFIRATFRAPLLVLHSDEDPLEPQLVSETGPVRERLSHKRFASHVVYHDRDWDFLQPILAHQLRMDVHPWPHLSESWHFYRHSLAGWNLNCWEALEAIALAGKTTVTFRHHWNLVIPETQAIFQGDERIRSLPQLTVPVRN